MLRVREIPERNTVGSDASVQAGRSSRLMRLAAMGGLGLALGAGGIIVTVSMVQAEDDAGIRAFHMQEAANRRAQRAPQQVDYASAPATAYAPARGWSLPLMRTLPDGRIAQPPIPLNPFKRVEPSRTARAHAGAAPARRSAARHDVVSGAADTARTICVRLCDGFHAPIGFLRSASDMKAHETLCQAMNPGIPVKVFRVAAGANTIDDAQAADGKTYRSLPVAYGHETGSDAACRPAIVQAGERRVSLLRDFTLRPGDSVVLDGKVRTFSGSVTWPYTTRDFRDFRSAAELSRSQREQIDERVGISRMEAQARSLQRTMRLREARLADDSVATDAVFLRGSIEPLLRGPVRMIPLTRVSGAL